MVYRIAVHWYVHMPGFYPNLQRCKYIDIHTFGVLPSNNQVVKHVIESTVHLAICRLLRRLLFGSNLAWTHRDYDAEILSKCAVWTTLARDIPAHFFRAFLRGVYQVMHGLNPAMHVKRPKKGITYWSAKIFNRPFNENISGVNW